MKIIFFTQEDPFYVKIFFDEFFANCPALNEIKAVVISKAMGHKSFIGLAKQMYGLYGPIHFLRVGFKYVFYKIMSKRKISKPIQSVKSVESADLIRTYSVKQTVESYGTEVIERSDINSEDFLSFIKKYEADIFISIASPIIFKESLINIPRLDCINIHNAPLPKYRGMLPNFWQLFHGEKESGITVHKIEKGIDTGDIITQQFLPIDPETTLDSLIRRTKKENARIIMDVIEAFRTNKVEYKKMEGEGSYFTFPTSRDVKEFKRRGMKTL